MNTNTGELYGLDNPNVQTQLKSFLAQNELTEVPEVYQEEASAILNGADHAIVDMTKNTPLVKWAKKDAKKKKRIKNKMTKSSRRKNRT